MWAWVQRLLCLPSLGLLPVLLPVSAWGRWVWGLLDLSSNCINETTCNRVSGKTNARQMHKCKYRSESGCPSTEGTSVNFSEKEKMLQRLLQRIYRQDVSTSR